MRVSEVWEYGRGHLHGDLAVCLRAHDGCATRRESCREDIERAGKEFVGDLCSSCECS